MLCVGVYSFRDCHYLPGCEFPPAANWEFCWIRVDPCPSVAENGYDTARCGATFGGVASRAPRMEAGKS